MAKISTLTVQGIKVALTTINDNDYICITDMVKAKDTDRPDMVIQNWMRNKDTIEFLGLWEMLNNPNFKPFEFEGFKNAAGSHRFSLTPKIWIDKTSAIGIRSKSGRYGGTFAHKDIAFEFASWISPAFKLYLIKELQRLKELESNYYGFEWDVKRVISKANYSLQTDAIKSSIIPKLPKGYNSDWAYANEADMLNVIIFGCTAKDWKELNPQKALKGENIRDSADIGELTILSNLESHNATLIKQGIPKKERFKILSEIAADQCRLISEYDYIKSIKKTPQIGDFKVDEQHGNNNLDDALRIALDYNPHKDRKNTPDEDQPEFFPEF